MRIMLRFIIIAISHKLSNGTPLLKGKNYGIILLIGETAWRKDCNPNFSGLPTYGYIHKYI